MVAFKGFDSWNKEGEERNKRRNKNLAKMKHLKIEKRREFFVNTNGIIHLKKLQFRLQGDSILSVKQMGIVLNGTNFLIYV